MYKVKGALKKVGSEDPGQGLKRKGEKDSNNNNDYKIGTKITKIWFSKFNDREKKSIENISLGEQLVL